VNRARARLTELLALDADDFGPDRLVKAALLMQTP
jgi:hypothetical protein